MKKKLNRGRMVFILVLIMVFACLAYAYAVFYGYVWLNHPSKTQYPIRGIDVSHYQGEIDWIEVNKQNQIDFVYVKATEGSSHVDKNFEKNWREVKEKTGFRLGAYHFFSFDSAGKTQLKNYSSQVETFETMLPPAVDVEFYGSNYKNPPAPKKVQKQLKVMLDGLEKLYNMKPMIYATEESYELYIKDMFSEYPLWIRNVTTKPKIGDKKWTMWQFTNRGRMKGIGSEIEPYVDINVFYGNREAFESLKLMTE